MQNDGAVAYIIYKMPLPLFVLSLFTVIFRRESA